MSKLYIPDEAVFKSKIEKIKAGGLSKLHIVSDFDRTLTGQSDGGRKPTTSWAIFMDELGPQYAKARQALFETYYPIERDMNLDQTYRSQQMSVWWRKHLDLLVKEGVDVNMIQNALKNENLKLRDGVKELFNTAATKGVPFLIFSAGIGDAIKLYLESLNLNTENVHILSNFFEFDANGKAVGFKNEVVHTFNKTEKLVGTKPYTHQVKERPNCLLLGDSVYDALMADDMPHEVTLKIGFLNNNIQDKETFAKIYDAILEEDTDISAVNELFSSFF